LRCKSYKLIQEFEQLGGGILIKSVGELGDCRRYFESLVQNDFLALKTNVFGPFDETRKIDFGTDVLT
jgi:hypothetical protein